MLQNAVHRLEELRQVKNQADQLQAYHGKVINYDSCCHLLLSAASNYDAKYAPKGRVGTIKAPKRMCMFMTLPTMKMMSSMMFTTWIVTLWTVQANVHKQNSKDPTFTRSGTLKNHVLLHLLGTEHSQNCEAQATWDLLSDEVYAIILGLHKDPGKCTVNVHNISVFDFLQASMHDLQLDNMEDTTSRS